MEKKGRKGKRKGEERGKKKEGALPSFLPDPGLSQPAGGYGNLIMGLLAQEASWTYSDMDLDLGLKLNCYKTTSTTPNDTKANAAV